MDAGTALQVAFFAVAWPGLVAVSGYALYGAFRFHRSLHRRAPGRLVLMTVVGWVGSLAGVALVSSFYLARDPLGAAPVVVPVLVLWAGSMTIIVWTIHRWGREAVGLESHYIELEQMDRMKSQFINNVAHELSTPLTPLRLHLKLLHDGHYGTLEPRQHAALEAVERNAERLGLLVQQVLLASQIQSGGVALHPQRTDLRTLLLLAEEEAAAMPGVESRVRVDVPEGLDVRCDPDRTRYAVAQVLAHCLREAKDVVVTAAPVVRGAAVRIEMRDGPASSEAFLGLTHGLEAWLSHRGLGMELHIARVLLDKQRIRIHLEWGPDNRVDAVVLGIEGRPTAPAQIRHVN